tara:strand:- start:15 stop:383 length:369 start_codon:yes stop_codon:yes gene_type:complete
MPKVTIDESLKDQTIVNLQKDNDQKQAELHKRQLKIMNLEVKLMKMCKTDAYEDRLKILRHTDSFTSLDAEMVVGFSDFHRSIARDERTDSYDAIAKSLLEKGLLYPSKRSNEPDGSKEEQE